MSSVDNMGAADIMREELAKLVSLTRKSSQARDDSSITSVLENIDANLRAGHADDDTISELARLLLDALSKSGLSRKIKFELSQRARTIWKGWKVDFNDINFERDRHGDKKRLGKGGFADVFLARMPKRDEDGEIIAGEYLEVAVKQFTILRSNAEAMFPQFIREVFLQKNAQHACIVQTYGGYWPSPEEIEEGDETIGPFIVMERMTHNLQSILDKGLLNSKDMKRRILNDIAAGIEHLHKHGIVHRDIKPENILMRVVDGNIIGRAKVSDFGVSRKAEFTELMTHTTEVFTKPTGSSYYMPPEAFNNSVTESSRRTRDVWSFGVVMCEVLEEGFLANIVRDNRDANRTEFAEKMVEGARHINCDDELRRIACSCLVVDPLCRQRIEYISARLANDIADHQFTFDKFYSKEYRANQVLAYLQKVFTVEAKNKIERSISVLEKVAREGTDSAAGSVLGYCYYYGIGVEEDKKKGKELFQEGCDSGNTIGMYGMGVIHYRANRDKSAVSMLTKAAKQGSTEAMRWLAVCYVYGDGVEKDLEESFRLVTCAAEGGNQHAEVELAIYLREGMGSKKDGRKGVAIMERLCASGNAWAAMNLGLWYKEGWVVQKDEKKANELIALAHKRGIVGDWVWNEKNKWWGIEQKKEGDETEMKIEQKKEEDERQKRGASWTSIFKLRKWSKG